MTARPIAVGDRVRVLRSWIEDEQVGAVVRIGDQTPHPSYGEPYSVGVRLDDDGRVLGYRLSELDRIDDPHTSSAPPTEDPADTLATPCATSATPDPVDPATGPAPEAGAASAHDAAPARVTYLDPALTPCPGGCETCQRREAVARRRVERDPQRVAEARRRDGDRCRYCGRDVRASSEGRVRATAYGVMLVCVLCSQRRVDEQHAPMPPAPITSPEPLDRLREMVVNSHDLVPVEPLGDDLERGPERIELCTLDSADLGPHVGMREGPLLPLHPSLDLCHNRHELANHTHESSPSGRAEAPESPQLMADTVGDGSDADTSLPTVGGRAVPPVPAPADTTGASSVHDAAPVTDLTTLQDAADRLAQVRAELDRLTALEYELATIVTDGLRSVVAVDVDLTWCVEPPAGSAS